jgi:hypothetical protein
VLDLISGKSVIVVAHPDDEVLWFSSILEKVDHVIFCYADVPGNDSLTDARRKMANTYPLANVSYLEIDETGAFNSACWDDPVTSAYGLGIMQHGPSPARYELVFPDLVSRLAAELATYQTVFTHNPWGEYGNEEHVQVSRAVQAAQALLGFDCWYSGYVSTKSYCLMNRYDFTDSTSMTFSIDQEYIEDYVVLYKQCGCWTWHTDRERFDSEVFYKNIRLKDGTRPTTQQPQLNRVRVDAGTAFNSQRAISKKLLSNDAKWAIPEIIDGYTIEKSGEHYLITGTGPRVGTIISSSASIILGLCDGTRTVTEIVEILSDTYGTEMKDIEEDVHDALIECYRRDILVMSFYSFPPASDDS